MRISACREKKTKKSKNETRNIYLLNSVSFYIKICLEPTSGEMPYMGAGDGSCVLEDIARKMDAKKDDN
jgi:hypothetical protein